ncbi:Extracellular serine-rich protein [Psilocybe cubensis]|uniref:Extracellular serine-rich protein n=2 Tax=Psilocybe cubensis TaxID=181762 RepID=A0ACB8HGG9_PSICU|nr:Extracellular serine-rich protein [Psilocybe cubensis]KAH9486797.1 Extracellular serine-rich protein [Psilocybe cubensis]
MFAFSLGLALLPFISAKVIDIQVGQNGLTYSPEAISAVPGDQVVFHFHAKNHTVTQSSFADPCGKKDGGINSGFQPVAANQTDNLPTFTVTVNDTQPVWIYCAQAAKTPASHCGAGMVFAINCGADGAPNSFTNFKKAALAVGASLSAAAATPVSTPADAATAWTTAAYGDYTIPPAPAATQVTQVITLGSTSTWTTTYASYPGSPAATPASAEGAVHTVTVGANGQLAFDPPFISAAPRDTIVFEFHQKNHTVTQSSFDDPCRKLNANGVTGFDSGFMPVAADATSFPTWNYTVTDTAPVWAYCRQQTPASHCGQGMVFAINSVETSARNFSAFQNVAKALNGTSLAVTSNTTTSGNNGNNSSGALSVSVGSVAGLSLFVAALIGTFL